MILKKTVYLKIFPLLCILYLTISCKKDDNSSFQEEEQGNSSIFNPVIEYGTVEDQEGNFYKTVKIGDQEWMAENLRSTKFCNGDSIPNVTIDTTWVNLNSGAWVYYENDNNYDKPYGKLYNWYAVDDQRNICPCNWHVPTDTEWADLIAYLGGGSIAGSKMKSTASEYWDDPNEATNESGFSIIPNGPRSLGGDFLELGYSAFLWSQTEFNTDQALTRYLYNYGSDIQKHEIFKYEGLGVRCIKD